ncbi:MAG: M48 family metallopeptidase [Candidatus Accumulibacter phosphatis]|uniref:M48 family metallopeptidase n=2 Tax=Pseudomonadota TaxID=1224 RepID=A0A7D5SKK9_9PROT|nr:SprT family zinc-dependent metalloprotease [Candidatus Thiothrix sp. Deng01]MCQ1549076.1 M48 family metallopeptidase [Candidatus Accumulibacter phosphatis]MEB4589477.1 SprT family zinc-dependent metalloprotease [Candidatus Thiothrix sp. Deng01]QLH48923.1 MAG: M48 family metallopeptidase [Candidatus Accumulibacter cognatus]
MQLRQVRDIHYQLLPGSDRQTADIVIERDGIITVRPPLRMTPEQVDETVLSKRMWIYRNLAEWRDLNATRVTREWVSGETFFYLGSHYRLQLVSEQDEPLKLKDGRFCLLREVIERDGPNAAHQVFESFYKSKGLPRIQKRVTYFAARVGVKAGDIRIKDLGYRWASCTKNGDLHFHWKCLMAPLTILDYIIVHELCHLHYRDHSDAFWNEVDKVLPDYREKKEWLRARGAELDL